LQHVAPTHLSVEIRQCDVQHFIGAHGEAMNRQFNHKPLSAFAPARPNAIER
jgi:hypothetical protein